MDVFSSALKNPLPPTRKRLDEENPRASNTPPVPQESARPPQTGASDMAPTARPQAQFAFELLIRDNRKKNSRRKHRNSHLGCGICKKRRIKCDEHLPQCLNCVKGRLHCAYLNLDAPARNALRLAQFNQNLRDEKNEDSTPKHPEKPALYPETPAYQPQMYSSVVDPVKKLMHGYMGNTSAINGDANDVQPPRTHSVVANPPHQAPIPRPGSVSGPGGVPGLGHGHMVPSAYVSQAPLLPMNHGVPYPKMPMQGQHQQSPAPLPHGHHNNRQAPQSASSTYPLLMYAERMQMPLHGLSPMPVNPSVYGQLFIYYPTQTHEPSMPYDEHGSGGYTMPIQRLYAMGPVVYSNGTGYPHEPRQPEMMVSAPHSNALSPPSAFQPLMALRPPHPSPTSPLVYANSTLPPNLPSMTILEANSVHIAGSKELEVPSVGLLLNSTSMGASPLIPPAVSLRNERNGNGFNSKDQPVKLAPIQSKVEDGGRHELNGTDFTPNDTEKINSIKMLLS